MTHRPKVCGVCFTNTTIYKVCVNDKCDGYMCYNCFKSYTETKSQCPFCIRYRWNFTYINEHIDGIIKSNLRIYSGIFITCSVCTSAICVRNVEENIDELVCSDCHCTFIRR